MFSTIVKTSFSDTFFSLYAGVRPFNGEFLSGEKVCFIRSDRYILLGVIDGMGHGKKAHAIANEIVLFIKANHSKEVDDILNLMHEKFKNKHGAAVSLMKVWEDGGYVYIGIGNVSCEIHSLMTRKSLVSQDGVIGLYMSQNIHIDKGFLDYDDIVIMYSDGLKGSLFKSEFRVPLVGSRELVNTIISQYGKDSDDVSFLYLNRELNIECS